MEVHDIRAVYFLGIGGIGMSALARYFLCQGLVVAGYDRTSSALTQHLADEGALVHYADDVSAIPFVCKDPAHCLVVYTPAIPGDLQELLFFREGGFTVEKRAEVLGRLTAAADGICVAGTHGKTTTTAMVAHILYQSAMGCSAFLGGIARNYASNYLAARDSRYVVVEADEYDRSFLSLHPLYAAITSVDADHLDIYGTEEAYRDSYAQFAALVRPGGALVVHKGLPLTLSLAEGVRLYDYGVDEGAFHAANVRVSAEQISFDFCTPTSTVENIVLSPPVAINLDNSIAALALAHLAGGDPEALRYGIRTFRGVERRFEVLFSSPRHAVVIDYGHHPAEVQASIASVRRLFPDRALTVLFQPHLYSRTRDFYAPFAAALAAADSVVLTDIYPAREMPIEGVSSRLIYDALPAGDKHLIPRGEIVPWAQQFAGDVLLLLGAGDLDVLAPQVVKKIKALDPCAATC